MAQDGLPQIYAYAAVENHVFLGLAAAARQHQVRPPPAPTWFVPMLADCPAALAHFTDDACHSCQIA